MNRDESSATPDDELTKRRLKKDKEARRKRNQALRDEEAEYGIYAAYLANALLNPEDIIVENPGLIVGSFYLFKLTYLTRYHWGRIVNIYPTHVEVDSAKYLAYDGEWESFPDNLFFPLFGLIAYPDDTPRAKKSKPQLTLV